MFGLTLLIAFAGFLLVIATVVCAIGMFSNRGPGFIGWFFGFLGCAVVWAFYIQIGNGTYG